MRYIMLFERSGQVSNLNGNHVSDALIQLKSIQDTLIDSTSRYFGQLLLQIVGTDTIPFYLITKSNGIFSLWDVTNHFQASVFRIEAVEKEANSATISLLRAVDFEGKDTTSITDIFKLEKTSTQVSINLNNIMAVQLLSPTLLNRKIIIEPKY